MPALVDRWGDEKSLPPQQRIVAVARWFLGTPYSQTKGRNAEPLDGVSSSGIRTIDCASFVSAVFAEVFPGGGINNAVRPNTTLLRVHPSFHTLRAEEPRQAGDVLFWPGHCGIVVDPTAKTFLHAPGTGRNVKYEKWIYMPGLDLVRRWASL